MAQSIDVGRGSVGVHVPPSYDSETPMPLVLLLHGYSLSGTVQEAYMQFTPLADEFGFLYLHPDGRTTTDPKRFWSATPACCNFYGAPDNDSDYLMDLINEMKSQYNVDSSRVYLIGHSNGGFMSYRMACDNAATIAAIASLAGATVPDANDCQASSPVHVLQIHGTNDASILYDGGFTYPAPGGEYTSAVESVEQWAAKNGCALTPDTSAPNIDLELNLPGAESTVTRYKSACDSGGSAELWTIVGGGHIPALSATLSRQIIEFFYAHPKLDPGPTDTVYSDFGYSGPKNGAQATPWNTLGEALAAVDANGTIKINGNSSIVASTETFTGASVIDNSVTIKAAPAGTVRIGTSTPAPDQAPNTPADPPLRSGFIMRND